jgi:hypothetical protein
MLLWAANRQVHREYKLRQETLFLAVNLLDRQVLSLLTLAQILLAGCSRQKPFPTSRNHLSLGCGKVSPHTNAADTSKTTEKSQLSRTFPSCAATPTRSPSFSDKRFRSYRSSPSPWATRRQRPFSSVWSTWTQRCLTRLKLVLSRDSSSSAAWRALCLSAFVQAGSHKLPFYSPIRLLFVSRANRQHNHVGWKVDADIEQVRTALLTAVSESPAPIVNKYSVLEFCCVATRARDWVYQQRYVKKVDCVDNELLVGCFRVGCWRRQKMLWIVVSGEMAESRGELVVGSERDLARLYKTEQQL